MTDFTSSNLVTIWVAGLGIAVGPAVAWMAYRFVKGKAVKAFQKGKL